MERRSGCRQRDWAVKMAPEREAGLHMAWPWSWRCNGGPHWGSLKVGLGVLPRRFQEAHYLLGWQPCLRERVYWQSFQALGPALRHVFFLPVVALNANASSPCMPRQMMKMSHPHPHPQMGTLRPRMRQNSNLYASDFSSIKSRSCPLYLPILPPLLPSHAPIQAELSFHQPSIYRTGLLASQPSQGDGGAQAISPAQHWVY